MQLTIMGLPKSGKTTLFNAVTRGHAQTSPVAVGAERANLGVAKVPDLRLDRLGAMFNPRRTVHAEVQYVDLPGGAMQDTKGKGITGEHLSLLQRADALVEVVRAFEDPSMPYPEGGRDPQEAVQTMDLELAFADLAILERVVQRREASLRAAKPAERDRLAAEHRVLARLKEGLEQDIPIRQQSITPDEERLLEGYQFLTAKPLLVVLNVGEQQVGEAEALASQLAARFGGPSKGFTALCARLEMELTQLSDEEEREFRASLGVVESGLQRMVRLSYETLGLITFLTYGPDENRAWSIPQGTPAVKAAAKIHTDIERGFIRAEVVAYDDLMQLGSIAEARRHGKVRMEGKTYPVCDGDIITFLFNV